MRKIISNHEARFYSRKRYAAQLTIFRDTLADLGIRARSYCETVPGCATRRVPERKVSDSAQKFEIIDPTRLADRKSGALGDQDIQARP